MRDLFVFGVVMGTLPLSFRRPFLGLLLFSWLAYMRPQDLCWGFARNMRFSFYVGFTMVAGWWANERGRVPFTRWDIRTRLLVALALLVGISYGFAKYQDSYYTRYLLEFAKIMAVALFTVGQCNSRQRLRWLFWTIALCLGFYGIKGGIFGVLSGGRPILRGPGGMLEDNNDFALGLVMNVPLLWYLGLDDRRVPFVRKATIAGIGLTAITILLTHSRGAFLALCSSLLWIAWRSRRIVQASMGLLLCVGMFFAFAPHHVIERLSTIGDTQESSAAARLTAWRTALRMIADNPILGVGMRNFQPRYRDYATGLIEGHSTTYVAHNSYLQIWAESGSIAFAIYLVLLASVFWTCRRVFRLSERRPDMPWLANYSRMMEATTVGFMVGAFFLNRGHFDLIYHWMALVSALSFVASSAWSRRLVESSGAGAVRVGWRPSPGSAPRWGRLV
ncbi:MAG: hypothetical protein Fur0037_13940 [Planctomycetota bacterium]